MSLTFPGFPQYQGGYPNIENLLKTVFTPLLEGSGIEPTYWLPKPDKIAEFFSAGGGKGYLRMYRTGGAINPLQSRDEPRVQFAAMTPARDDSWELIEFVRQVVQEGYGHAAAIVKGTPHKLQTSGEVVGPQLIPELIQDDRLVPITVEFYTWRPKGLPNYRQALGL